MLNKNNRCIFSLASLQFGTTPLCLPTQTYVPIQSPVDPSLLAVAKAPTSPAHVPDQSKPLSELQIVVQHTRKPRITFNYSPARRRQRLRASIHQSITNCSKRITAPPKITTKLAISLFLISRTVSTIRLTGSRFTRCTSTARGSISGGRIPCW